jgi:hypothetical protein
MGLGTRVAEERLRVAQSKTDVVGIRPTDGAQSLRVGLRRAARNVLTRREPPEESEGEDGDSKRDVHGFIETRDAHRGEAFAKKPAPTQTRGGGRRSPGADENPVSGRAPPERRRVRATGSISVGPTESGDPSG